MRMPTFTNFIQHSIVFIEISIHRNQYSWEPSQFLITGTGEVKYIHKKY